MDSGKSLQPKGQTVGGASELYSNLILFTPSRLIFIFLAGLAPSEPAYIIFSSCFSRATIAESVTSDSSPIVLKALNLSLPGVCRWLRGGGEWSGQLSCGGWWRPCRRKIPLFTVRNASLTHIWSFHARGEEEKKSPHYSLFYCAFRSVCGGEQHFPSKGCFETSLYNTQNKTMHVAFPRKGAAFLLWATGQLLSPGSLRRLGSADVRVFVCTFLQMCVLPKQNAAVGLVTMCLRTTRCTLGPFACPASSRPLRLRACTDPLTPPPQGTEARKKKSSPGWKRAQRELIVAVPAKLSLTSTSTRSICSSSPQRSCGENRRGFGLGWGEVASGLIQTSNAAARCKSNESFSTYPSELSALLFPPPPRLLQSRSDLNLCVWSNTSWRQNIHNCWIEAKMKETWALSEHAVLKVFEGDVLLG